MYRDFIHPASQIQRTRYPQAGYSAPRRSRRVRRLVGRSLIEMGNRLLGAPAASQPLPGGSV